MHDKTSPVNRAVSDSERKCAPAYNTALVQHALLEEVVELHPARLTIPVLCLRIASDPNDDREAETIRDAIRGLRHTGLFRYRDDDEVVEPTYAALHAIELLTR